MLIMLLICLWLSWSLNKEKITHKEEQIVSSASIYKEAGSHTLWYSLLSYYTHTHTPSPEVNPPGSVLSHLDQRSTNPFHIFSKLVWEWMRRRLVSISHCVCVCVCVRERECCMHACMLLSVSLLMWSRVCVCDGMKAEIMLVEPWQLASSSSGSSSSSCSIIDWRQIEKWKTENKMKANSSLSLSVFVQHRNDTAALWNLSFSQNKAAEDAVSKPVRARPAAWQRFVFSPSQVRDVHPNNHPVYFCSVHSEF